MGNSQNYIVQRRVEATREWIFCISFAILLVIHCFENTALIYNNYSWIGILYTTKKLLYLVLLCKIVFLSNFTFVEMILTAAYLLISGVGYYFCDDVALLELGIILFSAKDIPTQQIARIYIFIKSISIPLTIIAWKANIIPTLYYRNGNGYYNTLGFCHRNVLGANIAILCITWLLVRYKQISWKDIMIWIALAGIAYKLAYSRTSTIMILLAIVMVVLFKFWGTTIFTNRELSMIIPNIVVILFLISLIGTIFYNTDNTYWKVIDAIFTRRFSSCNYCFSKFGISILGQKIPFVSSLQAQKLGIDKLILDNSYARAAIYYGLIPGGIILIMNHILLKKAWIKNNGAVVICIALMAIYGLSERYMMDIYYQLPLIVAYQFCFLDEGNTGLNEID